LTHEYESSVLDLWIRPFAPARTGTTTASADSRHPFPMRRRMGSRFSTGRRASRDKTYVCALVRCGFTLTASSEISGVSVHGRLTRPPGLRIRFLFVPSEFCRRLPSDPRLAATPLPLASDSVSLRLAEDSHLIRRTPCPAYQCGGPGFMPGPRCELVCRKLS
jgi:hypothetical protein